MKNSVMGNRVRDFLRQKIKAQIFTAGALCFGRPFDKMIEVYEGQLTPRIDRPVNATTSFDLQSITKALATSLLAMTLERAGKIKFDSAIDFYLPWAAPQALASKGITFKHLLTHSSGLSDSDLEREFPTTYALWDQIFSSKPHFKPGTAIEYCDLGYRVLGKILETLMDENLEVAIQRLLYSNLNLDCLTYSPVNSFNIAGCPDSHGVIDDEQVRQLGGITGGDGLFGSAKSIFDLVSAYMQPTSPLGDSLGNLLAAHITKSNLPSKSYFDALATGSKTLGWEVNPREFSYAGRFHSKTCFEKAGGAGTFIWFDQSTEYIMVYLTNHGKPKPFTEQSWNRLVADLEPNALSDLIYDVIHN